MRIRPLLLIPLLALASCEQARPYPPAPGSTLPQAAPREKQPLPVIWSWLEPFDTAIDAPIELVPPAAPLWAKLPEFWNPDPLPGVGAPTVHLGLPPLQAIAAFGMADQVPQRFRIKVPRGLPDPNPRIPPANPLTYNKWRLGRDLFFAPILQSGTETYACATCHRPSHGFTESRNRRGSFNTLSLINVVYNRHQFWDGRAVALEEVVVRALEDERPATEEPERQPPEITHRWGGLVNELDANFAFRNRFEVVFGIRKPTQDAIAKALATYMRTVLSGDSLYDRAQAQAGAATLSSEHFLPLLDDATLTSLGDGTLKKDAAARQLVLGYQLFNGKANCAACHRGELFTDHEFHNTGVNAKDRLPPIDAPTGRFTTVPIGLKEKRLIGAYRTPSLRALPRTGPYFHDGSYHSLREAVTFYDRGIAPTPYLAAALRRRDREQQLKLTDPEIDALVLFLHALDGAPLDPIVAAAPR